jgi:hypothetical protein
MIARRVLLLAAVMFVTAALASALAPSDLRRPADEDTQTTPAAVSQGPVRAEPRARVIVVEEALAADAPRPVTLRASVGSLIRLTVNATAPDTVTIDERSAAVDERTPARFEFFAERAGSFPIALVEAQRTVGTLEVTAPE